jgi:hypothetical protein
MSAFACCDDFVTARQIEHDGMRFTPERTQAEYRHNAHHKTAYHQRQDHCRRSGEPGRSGASGLTALGRRFSEYGTPAFGEPA